MPIPTRSGSIKVNRSTENRPPTITGSRAASKLSQSASNESTKLSTESEGLKTNRATRLVQPKLVSHSVTTPNTTVDVKPQGLARSASTASKPSIPSAKAQSRQERRLSGTSTPQVAVSHGHSGQQSVTVPKPRSAPLGHSRTASAATSQPTKSSNFGKLTARPNFTTFQQHYSPRKPAVGSAKSSAESKPQHVDASNFSSQHQALSDELLQLYLVHRDANRSLKSFIASAERQIVDLQEAVYARQAYVAQIASEYQRLISLKELDNWLTSSQTCSDEQQVQRLSKTIDELQNFEKSLTAVDGLLTKFDEWHSNALEIQSNRSSSAMPKDFQSVRSLGLSWVQAMQLAEQRASACLTILQGMKPLGGESGIHSLIAGHIELAQSLVAEVNLALKVEKAIADQERLWMNREIEAAIEEVSKGQQTKTQPIWNEL